MALPLSARSYADAAPYYVTDATNTYAVIAAHTAAVAKMPVARCRAATLLRAVTRCYMPLTPLRYELHTHTPLLPLRLPMSRHELPTYAITPLIAATLLIDYQLRGHDATPILMRAFMNMPIRCALRATLKMLALMLLLHTRYVVVTHAMVGVVDAAATHTLAVAIHSAAMTYADAAGYCWLLADDY